MRRTTAVGTMVLPAFLIAAAPSPAAPQVPRPIGPTEPLPKGQQIEAKDGDTVLIRGDARVRIIHRGEAAVRTIYNSSDRWLIVLADFAASPKAAPDGFVDSTFSFHDVDGAWPLGERWQGSATIDEYSMAYMAAGSYAITTDGASIQLFSGSAATIGRWFVDPRATALTYRGGGRSNTPPGESRLTFDQAEERAIGDATRNVQRRDGAMTTTLEGPGGTRLTSRVGMMAPAPATGGARSGDAPVRVGGGVASPQKIFDVQPDTPSVAAQAGVRGTVILEIVVGVDGAVTSAKVLRSIPLLDQAALDAVRRWRYTPTLMDGRPVPVILTVTVNFP